MVPRDGPTMETRRYYVWLTSMLKLGVGEQVHVRQVLPPTTWKHFSQVHPRGKLHCIKIHPVAHDGIG